MEALSFDFADVMLQHWKSYGSFAYVVVAAVDDAADSKNSFDS